MKTECSCGRSYWPNQAWQHKACATNSKPAPTNKVIESPTNSKPEGRTANGRSRQAYNAYQRAYMRRYRADHKHA